MRCNDCTHYDVCYQYDIIGEDDNEMCALYEQKRKHGEWVPKAVHNCWTRFECSVCGYYHEPVHDFGESKPDYNFCPNCGASMISSNSEIEKSKSEIVPDYRDGWRLRGEAE